MNPSPNATRARSRRTSRRVALGGALAALLAAAAVIALRSQHAASSGAADAQGDFAGLVAIGGGRRLYLECRGGGSPTVILEAGYGNTGRTWTDTLPDLPTPPVLQGVAGFTRVCTYDRPNTFLGSPVDAAQDSALRSRSDPVAQPRTAAEVVADLHALLHAAAVPDPYVLAGIDLGGDVARLYAHRYPEQVVGLVLVDARPDGLLGTIEPRLTAPQWQALRTFLDQPQVSIFASEALVRRYGLEGFDFAALDGVLGAAMATPLREMPLAVLANGAGFGLPETDMDLGYSQTVLAEAWRVAQEALPALVPHARFFVVERGGYGGIPAVQPAVVTEAIRQVVAGVRDPDTWYDLVSCCAK
jgi:pimeloyl-ACP methyl ester carboxylesterase